MYKINIVGEDERSLFLKEMLQKENIYTNLKEADYVYYSIPFRKYNNLEEIVNKKEKIILGGASKSQKEYLDANEIEYIDLMKNEKFVYGNAKLTAEAASLMCMLESKKSLENLNILVLGYGRIGKNLTEILKKMKSNVYCMARRKESIEKIISLKYNYVKFENIYESLSNIDVVINTIPENILDKNILLKIKKNNILLLELASSPYGMDIKEADSLEVEYKILSALPAKVLPKTAASLVKEAIYDEIIKEK